jgi:ubiquinone/menaquinone biosynthesis C-methylase UbiE
MQGDEQIQFNKQAGDRVSARYERLHGEIFNPIEQQRLRAALTAARIAVKTGATPLRALDYGCGSGNLTRHLIELGIYTISADVSEGFLGLIESRFHQTRLSEGLLINGKDLSNVPDDSFDLAATYSVLHHVPDYLHIVREMCRVLKPGGIIYLDHEANESYFSKPKEYIEFLKKARPIINVRRCLRLLLDVRGYVHILRRLMNPRYKPEGDIHVWPDDHVEWAKIEKLLSSEGFEIVLKQDYLLYRNNYKLDVYEQYNDRCADETVLIARKR